MSITECIILGVYIDLGRPFILGLYNRNGFIGGLNPELPNTPWHALV